MTDLIAEIDAITQNSASKAVMLLIRCRAEIIRLSPSEDWLPIATLAFPVNNGSYSRTEGKVWLADMRTGLVMDRRPMLRHRDCCVGVFGEDFYPTHWRKYVIPAPPEAP